MPPTKRKVPSPVPFIAGADDPILNSNATFPSGDKNFLAGDYMDYTTGSPDTLQHLDATNQSKPSPHFPTSQPNDLTEGGYHEMSDDSAGSSKRSGKRDETMSVDDASPKDTTMAADGTAQGLDLDTMLDFSECADFTSSRPGTASDEPFTGDLAMDMFGGSNDVFQFGSQQLSGARERGMEADGTLDPFSMSFQSPGMPTIAPDVGSAPHNRQNSMHSIESGAHSWQMASEHTSPMATSHTNSQMHTPAQSPSNSLDWHSAGNETVHATPVQQAPSDRPSQQFAAPMYQPQFSNGNMAFAAQGQLMPAAQPYRLHIPTEPAKSRVETQTSITLVLTPSPPGITKLHLPAETISKPKQRENPSPSPNPGTLELSVAVVCTTAMMNYDLYQKALEAAKTRPPRYLPPDDESGENSPQNGGEVRICEGCMNRERKRAGRKRIKDQGEEDAWLNDEKYRVVVMNSAETRDWENHYDTNNPDAQTGLKVSLVTRIACYCRHHKEKNGFNVIFTLKDWQGKVIAQQMSNQIFVTDDHKGDDEKVIPAPLPNHNIAPPSHHSQYPPQHAVSQPALQQAAQPPDYGPPSASIEGPSPSQANVPRPLRPGPKNGLKSIPKPGVKTASKTTPKGVTKSGSKASPKTASRAASPSRAGPSAKKRKSSAGVSRVPKSLSMTKFEDSSPESQTSRAPSMESAVSPSNGLDYAGGPPGSRPPPPPLSNTFSNSNPPSRIPSRVPSRVPSPNHVAQTPRGPFPHQFSPMNSATADQGHRTIDAGVQQQGMAGMNMPAMGQSQRGLIGLQMQGMEGVVQAGAFSDTANSPEAMNQNIQPGTSRSPVVAPHLSKVVPHEGSITGGIEVTVLGRYFRNGMEVWFGQQKAHFTAFWSENSLICLLPPAASPGVVPVTCVLPPGLLNGEAAPTPDWSHSTMFRYIDDTEDRLIRMALRTIGTKMTGQDVDVNQVARQVLQQQSQGGGGQLQGGGVPGEMMFNQGATGDQLESQLLGCLDFIDNDDSPYEADLDLKSSSGHTMLHLASVRGFRRLVSALLVRGADPNAMDNAECTPLHLAAIGDRPEVAKRLMRAGADPEAENLSGETPVDVAESGEVRRAIRYSLARSRSADFSQSRTSSVSSLRSMCEPLTRLSTAAQEPTPVDHGHDTSGYTSGAEAEDEDVDEDVHLHMRSSAKHRPTPQRQTRRPPPVANIGGEVPQISSMADLKEHFQAQFNHLQQSWQQSWAMHTQNLPHLPQMPQMPQMPALPANFPDYHAYFQQAPLVRRMTQYMPGMNGSRPESQDGSEVKLDHRWWDLSSFMNQTPAPPPAYDEIYPHEDMDTKQTSAAQAAAEAEADMKCSQLYDQEEEEAESSSAMSTVEEPSVLRIGRKNAITKEQQEQLLRARDRKHTRLRNDLNLFVVWIPLLLFVLLAMLYSYFPSLPAMAINIVLAIAATVRQLFSQSGATEVARPENGAPAAVEQAAQ